MALRWMHVDVLLDKDLDVRLDSLRENLFCDDKEATELRSESDSLEKRSVLSYECLEYVNEAVHDYSKRILCTTCSEINLFEKGYEKDPAIVAKEAIQEATCSGKYMVLVDTAGRMQVCYLNLHISSNLSLKASVKITCNLCGVSCTSEGEAIIRGTLARDVAAVMEYKGLKLQEAVDWVVKNRLDGQAGMIVVSNEGEVAYGFNSNAMFRGVSLKTGSWRWAFGSKHVTAPNSQCIWVRPA
ncbi:hypothetical protein Sjap_009335 [Stephania japonica]|uniref:SRP54-type proteins GTP-binding domain-containing protein n=1 Tax=Stephania japonica TaxID=461633 RepID=A0AAP0JR62_9MAGN